jgi:hypothetical protein
MIGKILTRRRALGSLAAATSTPALFSLDPASARSAGAPSPDRVFVDMELAAAEAAVASGESFRILDSASGLATAYLRTPGGSEVLYHEATLSALAARQEDLGAALIGADDGASGDLWTTVKGFIDRLRSPSGASVLGFRQNAEAGVGRTVEAKLRERVTPLDFGAAGDADPGDNTAGTDDSEAVQAAFDFCADQPGTSLYLAGRFYKVANVRIPPRPDGRRWFVFGEGGGFVNPATASSDVPCLFHSSLARRGDARRTFDYSPGVTLVDVNFHGSGHGVGYMHAISGHLHHYNCSFQDLEDGLLTIGVAGVVGRNPMFIRCYRGAHAARNAEYPMTAGYTQETSSGWNDGYFIDGGQFRQCTYGLLHKGTENAGVVGISRMIWTGARQSYVETHGNFRSVEIAQVWCEYTRAGQGGEAVADVIRFWRSRGADEGGESPGRFTVRHCNFYLSSPRPRNGMNTYAVRRVIDARVNAHIHDNVFTAARDAIYETVIYNNIGSNGAPLPPIDVTPYDTSAVASTGRIAFRDRDLESLGDPESIFYMSDGDRTYLLTRRGAHSEGVSAYAIHPFTPVYSPQFAAVGPGWPSKGRQHARTAPVGVACDFDKTVSGMEPPAGTVRLWSGLNGGVSRFEDGEAGGGLITIERNVCQYIDMRRFYAQREFGRYVMRDNISRA